MLKQKEGVSQFRTSDKQRGVEFSSVETQKILLAFVKAKDEKEYRQVADIKAANPGLRHFIEVIANGGVIPQNNSKFEAILKRKGILASDIPNILRAYYLAHFSGGNKMLMDWWETIPLDGRQDFIAYLKKVVQLKNELPLLAFEDQRKIRELIIPILEDGGGLIPENMDEVQMLAQRWSMTNHQLAEMINRLWERMTAQLSAEQAGRIVGRSAGTMRRWAREDKIDVEIDHKGHWAFTRKILIDHINKTPKGNRLKKHTVICQPWSQGRSEEMPSLCAFSLHLTEEDRQTFVGLPWIREGQTPEGAPYEIDICIEQYLPLLSTQCGIYVHTDKKHPHAELQKSA